MDSARSFKASRTSYGRFVLKDYVQGGTNTGAGVAGQQSEMGNMKGQTTQNQGKNNESGKQSQVLTTGGVRSAGAGGEYEKDGQSAAAQRFRQRNGQAAQLYHAVYLYAALWRRQDPQIYGGG